MNRYKFNLIDFDECLNSASLEEKVHIKRQIEKIYVDAVDEYDAYRKLIWNFNSQKLIIHNVNKAYFELIDFSQGIYVEYYQIG